jgi:hypothetical protein
LQLADPLVADGLQLKDQLLLQLVHVVGDGRDEVRGPLARDAGVVAVQVRQQPRADVALAEWRRAEMGQTAGFPLENEPMTAREVISLGPLYLTVADGIHFGLPGFDLYAGNGIAWFRVFGWGLHWKDLRRHQLNFSERNGLVKKLRIGDWLFGGLRPYLARAR